MLGNQMPHRRPCCALVCLAVLGTLIASGCTKSRAPESIEGIAEPITTRGWIRFKPDVNIDPRSFFDQYGHLLKLSAGTAMRIVDESPDDLGFVRIHFQQYFRDIEVEGAQFYVHALGIRAVSANGHLVTEFEPETTSPRLSEQEALSIVRKRVGTDRFYDGNRLVNELVNGASGHVPKGELVFAEDPKSRRRVLAWRFAAYVEPVGSSLRVYVDAATGTIIRGDPLLPNCFAGNGPTTFRGTQNFNTAQRNIPNTGQRFVLLDDCHGNELHLQNQATVGGTKEVFDDDNLWADQNISQVTSYWALGIAYDYFDLQLKRKSYDNKNSNMFIRNDASIGKTSGGGGVISIETGSNATHDYNTTDIVGHEFTHSVTETSAKLSYDTTKESAALNESFSDIFGMMVRRWEEGAKSTSWVIGDEKGCTGAAVCRDLKNPKTFGEPDTYQGSNWQSTPPIDPHVNGTVQNRWFVLLADGGSGKNDVGDPYNVTGIGIQKATRIAYRTLTSYLDSSSAYVDARDGSIEAAIDLFGGSSAEEDEVTKAWCAVKLCPYTVPKQPDRFDLPGGNPNPASPDNNNSVPGATPIGSSTIIPIGSSGTIGWGVGAHPTLKVRNLSIYPPNDSDYFRSFPHVNGPVLGGRCAASGFSFVFSNPVDASVIVNGRAIRQEHDVGHFTVDFPTATAGDFVLEVTAPFPGQIINYDLTVAFFVGLRGDCLQNKPPNIIEEIHSCPMCNVRVLSGLDEVVLNPDYRHPDFVAPTEHLFFFRGGALEVPVKVQQGGALRVQLVDEAGKVIAEADREAQSDTLNVGAGNLTEGIYRLRFSGFYRLRFSGYGNDTKISVQTPVR